MKNNDATSRMRNPFIAYHFLFHKSGVLWVIEDNSKLLHHVHGFSKGIAHSCKIKSVVRLQALEVRLQYVHATLIEAGRRFSNPGHRPYKETRRKREKQVQAIKGSSNTIKIADRKRQRRNHLFFYTRTILRAASGTS